ncbi:hypothetical protein [Meiothermus hypogaeus]|uniref:Uncharacterized protein n=2 Tax=Meiothermus hypogaeus TaxID=884155 RepID=A0A511R2T0_9DEIN|nr:hypothetical protein [Meiothermus hypogaeus]RIH74590.1 hypothetical protein Mhypo_03267 [Meiothermus hypogaeus]GEM83920.1 hypothetical protein MHY01S_20860 [Meiothermus hypogaeus NBRC 106114]
MQLCPIQLKYRHPDRCNALRAARIIGKRKGIKLYVYRCPHCQDWHLTHRSSSEFATLKEIHYG